VASPHTIDGVNASDRPYINSVVSHPRGLTCDLPTSQGRFDVDDVVSGKRALQAIPPVPANDLILSRATDAHIPEPSFELVASETGDFQDISLGDRDVMFILTTEASIQVHNFKAGNEAILFVGQIPILAIEQLAKQFKLKFTSDERGIYSSRFHPDSGMYPASAMPSLAGMLTQTRYIHIDSKPPLVSSWRVSIPQFSTSAEQIPKPAWRLCHKCRRCFGSGWKAGSKCKYHSGLGKEKIEVAAPGRLDDKVCSVCLAALEVTKLPCGHYFHFICIKPWLEKVDSCPQCRSNIDPAGTHATQS
jgi:hypothetical protein